MTDCTNEYTWISDGQFEWVDTELIPWGVCIDSDASLNQVVMDTDYVYAATSSGIDIFDIYTSNKVSYIQVDSGCSTIWASSDKVYIGTQYDGVLYIDKDCLQNGDCTFCLLEYDYVYGPTSNTIKYIHGSDNTIAVVTSSGVDVLHNAEDTDFKSTTSNTEVVKCFFTSKNELYYFENNSIDEASFLYKVNDARCDWTTPDYTYEVGKSFLQKDVNLTDIYVTENTSSVIGHNTLFVATTSGGYILDEGTGEFEVYYNKIHI